MKPTILVIEDHEQNRYLMKYLLEAHDCQVILTENGHDGIQAAKEIEPDLILLDIQLPGISGHDVARILQADSALSTIPIIAVTSYAMPGDREQAMASGCTGYIEKPIDPDKFVDEIFLFLVQRPDSGERSSAATIGG